MEGARTSSVYAPESPLTKALKIVLMLVGILFVGAFGYILIEGWTFFDALYMTVITLATVGFGETHPLSNAGRAFTIFLILGGIGIITYGVTTVTAFLVEGEMNGYLRRRRMQRAIGKLKEHYIVCGGGKNGRYVIEELRRTKRDVVVVERHRDRVQSLLEDGVLALEGDATSDNTLLTAGIERATGLVATLPEDRDNLFVVITARGLNSHLRIVAKIDDVNVRDKFIRSGANSAVSASSIGGMRMASELIRPDTVTFLDTMLRDSANFRVEDIPVGPSHVGKTIQECHILASAGILVVALKDEGKYSFNPKPTLKLRAGDTLIVIGDPDHVHQAAESIGR
ncbi:MAG: potassium channel protein [Bacteroidetes bacterium]|jgi:voltage-gated potassium channel|nr:potassium channel protein [Bacteroidota bacterium]